MDDAATGSPEASAVLGGCGAQEVIDFAVLGKRLAQVGCAFDARLNEMVAVDGGGYGNGFALGLHELEHACLPKNVLQNYAVRADVAGSSRRGTIS